MARDGGQPGTAVIEGKIALGAVSGRIDHLADRPRGGSACLSPNSATTAWAWSISPPAKCCGPSTVSRSRRASATSRRPIRSMSPMPATARCASLRGEDFTPLGRIELGSDADNVRIDPSHRRVLVGYGDGALAIIDPAIAHARPATCRCPRIPRASSSSMAARGPPSTCRTLTRSASPTWPGARSRDPDRGAWPRTFRWRSTRRPAAFSSPFAARRCWRPTRSADGQLAARLPICADADDLFIDAKRQRVYVSCGAGFVDVLESSGSGYARLARVPTASGARTSLFVPELDRLYVAARARRSEPAAIWVFRPMP